METQNETQIEREIDTRNESENETTRMHENPKIEQVRKDESHLTFFEAEAFCRVCHGESEPDRPLFHPCRCDGSIKFLHQDCLLEWLRVSNKGDNKCELCGEKFSFRRVYAPDAPSRLSFWEFLSGVLPIVYLYLQNFFQIVIVSLFWLFIVPVVSMWWLNLCLGYLNLGVWSWGSPKISQFDILLLWWDGVIVSALIGLASFCLAILLRPVFRELFERLKFLFGERRFPPATPPAVIEPSPDVTRVEEQPLTESLPLEADTLENNQSVENDPTQGDAPIDQAPNRVFDENPIIVDIDIDRQFHQLLLASPLWKSILVSLLLCVNNIAFLSGFILVPVHLGRALLNTLVHFISIHHPISFQDVQNENIFKLNIQNHNQYLYYLVFRVLERQNYPYPQSNDDEDSPMTTDQFYSDYSQFEDEFNIFHRTSKIPLTIDRMTSKFILILEILVGYMFLSTCILILVSGYILLAKGNFHEETRRGNQHLQPNQNEPPHSYVERLIQMFTHLAKWLKVFVFLSFEYFLIPHLIGWVLDFVTLKIFATTIESRILFFQQNPFICIFIHFIVGLLFNLHVGMFISEIRKIVKYEYLDKFLPESLSFDENSLDAISNSSVKFLFERILFSLSCSIPCIVLMILIPSQFGHLTYPNGVEYSLKYGETSYDVQLPLELLLFHFFLPALVRKYNHPMCLRVFVHTVLIWCCELVHMRNFLEPEIVDEFCHMYPFISPPLQQFEAVRQQTNNREEIQPDPTEERTNEIENVESLDILSNPKIVFLTESDHLQNFIQSDETNFQNQNSEQGNLERRNAYFKGFFIISVFTLATMLVFSWVLHFPLILGRMCLTCLRIKVENDFYSLSVGYSFVLGCYFALAHLAKEAHHRPELIALCNLVTRWILVSIKVLILGLIWLAIIPLLLGILIEAVFVFPLWISHVESPSYSYLQFWAIGLLAITAWLRGILLGIFGDVLWRVRFQLIVLRGFEHVDFSFILLHVISPVVAGLLDHLIVPYCLARIFGLMYPHSYHIRTLIMRYSFGMYFLIRQSFRSYGFMKEKLLKLHNDIRDSRYLLGVELNNRKLN